jgi:hypothetical protein
MIPYNVFINDFNAKKFITYDIMPYLISEYDKLKDKPTTFEDCKKFINTTSMHKFWGKCEYEVILVEWPSGSHEKKIDIYDQIKMNIDVITKIFMKNGNI